VSSGLELADALDACAKLGQMTRASLARYEPEALGTYRWGSTGAPHSWSISRC